MGRYITHEQLPFKGKLVKIRMRRYGFSNVASQLQNEEELLEITPDGIVKLSATRIDGREKCKVQIPVDDAAYIFNAFTTVFSEYKKEKVPGYSGFWKVRLLTDEDEVFLYHGSNGQDYMYEGKTLTEILRERATLEELNGFAMRIFDKSNLSFGIRVANTKLIVELFFCAALRKDHLLIVVGRGKVRLEHDIVEQLLAGCEQNIDLRTPGIMLGL